MIDVDLIQQCADPRLEVAVVQQFVVEMNAPDHLAIRVFQGEKMILVPAPKSAEEAVATTRQWVGKASVRVGLTQYPAGLGVTDPLEIGLELFDACENLRLGTELFGKVLRIVGERHEEGEAPGFQTAVQAYFTGWFDGEQIYYQEDPGPVQNSSRSRDEEKPLGIANSGEVTFPQTADPNRAGIRVDMSVLRQTSDN